MQAKNFPIGLYGKIPIFADFISINASGREARALHQWFQEGLYVCRNTFPHWPDEFNQMPRYAFLFNAGSMESYMIGCLGPGEDQGGRKYPFSMFSIIIQKILDMKISMAPLVFTKFIADAYSMINGGWMNMDARALSTWAQNTFASPEEQNLKLNLSSWTVEYFLSNILGKFQDDRKYLIFQNLVDLLLPMRNQKTQRFTLGLRLPLSSQQALWYFETVLWLEIIFRYLGRAPTTPVFFWNVDVTRFPPYMFLYLQPPAPRHFAHLVQPDSESELMCNLDVEGMDRISSIKSSMKTQLKEWLDTANLNIFEFIEKFSSIYS